MKSKEALLDIDQVHQLTGIAQATLRNWEKRYGFPKPQRSAGGHRLFCVEDVSKLKKVVELLNGGTKLSEAIKGVLSGSVSVVAKSDAFENGADSIQEEMSVVLKMLYRYDEMAAEDCLSRIGMRLSEKELLENVYPGLLYKIGDDWESGRINIAQEHFSWNFFRSKLLNFIRNRKSTGVERRFVLATPSGERHEGGLLILAAAMTLKGWKVYYLGPDLPVNDLSHAIDVIAPDVVCLSASMATNVKSILPELISLNRAVVLGGSSVSQLKAEGFEAPSPFFLIEGSVTSAIEQVELLLHTVVQNLDM